MAAAIAALSSVLTSETPARLSRSSSPVPGILPNIVCVNLYFLMLFKVGSRNVEREACLTLSYSIQML